MSFHHLKQYRSLDTISLISSCIKRDPLAWAEFIRRYNRYALMAFKKRLSFYSFQYNNKDLEDLSQDFFVALWQDEKLKLVEGSTCINHWIVMLAGNFATDYYRKSKKEVLRDTSSLEDDIISKKISEGSLNILGRHGVDTRSKIEATLLEEKIERSISKLSNRERIAIKLNVYYGLKYREIAYALKMSIGTVSSMIGRIKKTIQENLQEN